MRATRLVAALAAAFGFAHSGGFPAQAGEGALARRVDFDVPARLKIRVPSGIGEYGYDRIEDLFAGDLDGDSRDDFVVVGTRCPGCKQEITLFRSSASGGFVQEDPVLLDFRCDHFVPADFDGDEDLDLACVDWTMINSEAGGPVRGVGQFHVLKNDGTGRFQALGPFSTPDFPDRGTAADLDGDGDVDLVLSHGACNIPITEISVYWNAGDGTFGPATKLPAIWDQRQIAAGDLDEDGLPEIVVTGQKLGKWPICWFWYGGLVAVIRNLGDGRFAAPEVYEVSYADRPWTIRLADMDRDGALDIVAGSANFSPITILWNDGKGRFPERSETIGIPTRRLRTADLDGDGLLDILSRGCVHRNLGGRQFAERVCYGAGWAEKLDVGDFDGDGWLDWVVAERVPDAGEFFVFRNRGGGRFPGARIYNIAEGSPEYAAASLVAGDFDKDGDLDLAATTYPIGPVNSYLIVLENRGDGTFAMSKPYYPPEEQLALLTDLIAEDLDGDGLLDLATCGWGITSAAGFLWNKGDGTFTDIELLQVSIESWGTNPNPTRIRAADLDSDGDLDVAVGAQNSFENGLTLFWNTGGRQFAERSDFFFYIEVPELPRPCGEDCRFPFAGEPYYPRMDDIEIGDFDGDGDPDILMTLSRLRKPGGIRPIVWNEVALLRNDGSRQFNLRKLGEVRGGVFHSDNDQVVGGQLNKRIASGDVDGDGSLDFVVSTGRDILYIGNDDVCRLTVFRNAGKGEFSAEEFTHPACSLAIALFDVDGDGDLDVLTRGAKELVVIFNDGTGRFRDATYWYIDDKPLMAVAGDFDADGRTDVAMTGRAFATVAVLLNQAEGPVSGEFRRGDVDGSGLVETGMTGYWGDISFLLYRLFYGAPPLRCEKAADVDDDGSIRITDAVYLVRYYFLGGDPPPEPFFSCGLDPTPDDLQECLSPNWSCR